MAVLAQSLALRTTDPQSWQQTAFPAVASDIIYQGALLGSSSGNARPLTAGDQFMGMSLVEVDNSAGAAGAKQVLALVEGCFYTATITGADGADDYGKAVYATNDNPDECTLTQNGSLVGRIDGYTSEAGFRVRMITRVNRDVT